MARRSPRSAWLPLAAGLLMGLVAGLIYAWFVDPVTYTDVSPDRLNPEDQQEYVQLVADAYLHDLDLARARLRLERLGAGSATLLVAEQADAALLRGEDPARVRSLATLAEALGGAPVAAGVFSGTSVPTSPPQTALPRASAVGAQPSPTPEPSATPTLVTPSPTPDRFPQRELILTAREVVCEDGASPPRIEVYVLDEQGEGIPGVPVLAEWAGGQETFFTGLKPEAGPGYADLDVEPDQTYTLTLVERGEPVVGLTTAACTTPSGSAATPGYRLTFTPSGSAAAPGG